MSMKAVATVLISAFCTIAVADHHHASSKWFDMENCDMCKPMAEHQDLMMNMKWETHLLDNGMVAVATVPEAHQDLMHKIHVEMKEKGVKLEKGEHLHLCGFCDSYGKLLEQGAKEQEVKTSFGMINLLTSDDPKLAAEIKKHAKKTMKEYEAMMKMAEAAPGK